jgi:hypothetical protein
MGPLGFVNWREVNAGFCALMWFVALVLAGVILMHVAAGPAAAHHVASVGGR